MKRPITYLYYLAQGKRRLYWQNKIDAIPLMEKMHYKFADREIESIEQVQQEMAQDILSGRPFMAGRLGAVELANMRAYEFDDRRILSKDVKQLCDCAGFFPNDISLMDQFFEEMINRCKSTDYLAAWFQPFEDYYLKHFFTREMHLTYLHYIDPFRCPEHPWTEALKGKKVLVIDTDLGLRNLDVVMGLENRIVYNLVDVINGSCRLKQALIRDRRHSELYLLPSAQTKDKTAVSPEQMIKLTDDLREEFDYVLLDCPAGIEQGFKNAVAGADRALVVTTPEVSAIRDADRIIGLLESGGLRDIRLIINRLRPEMIARGDMMSVEDVLEILAVDLIGAILDDEQIVISTNQGEPLSGKNSQAEEEYRNICRRLMGEEVPYVTVRRKNGVFHRLGSIFRK